MKRFYVAIWDFTEYFYKVTGLRIQTPIELVFPNFCPWLFGKMIGQKGTQVKIGKLKLVAEEDDND